MGTKFKISGFIGLSLLAILILNIKISKGDLSFYFGKDDGYLSRLYLTCILSLLFYLILSKRKRILNTIAGLLVGVVASVISYFSINLLMNNFYTGFIFSVVSLCLGVTPFWFIHKQKQAKEKLKRIEIM